MKRRAFELTAALTLLCLSGMASASGGGEEGVISPFAGDIGNVLWTLVIFLLVVTVLGKFAWGPMLASLQSREKFIHDSLAEAKQEREKAATQLARYEAELANARVEATKIADEGRRDAEALKKKIEAHADDEAKRIIERAKREIDVAKQAAVHDIYAQAGRLATDLAGRIIHKELDPSTHAALISETINRLNLPERN
jgi:F-type H+-transporting ATPase subunit b